MSDFARDGYQVFPAEPDVSAWVQQAKPVADAILSEPENRKAWLRCGGTWYVGVNALPNDSCGRVDGGPALKGAALAFATERFGAYPLDRAQLSAIYPGYPRPSELESEAAFRFRRDRDAAHVDGLLPVGTNRRRHLQEPHGFVLGVPLDEAWESPMVVWAGSHLIMQAAFREALGDVAPEDWGQVDLTEIYQAARRQCFERCPRVALRVSLGGAYVIHPLSLHGVAPWSRDKRGTAGTQRIVAYFRPAARVTPEWLMDQS